MLTNFFDTDHSELQDKVILNVDDNEMNQLVIEKILARLGIKIFTALNGEQAIEKLNAGLKPDAILMDLQMPVLNGIQTTEFIRKRIDANIPIIINSGNVEPDEKWKLKKLGVKDFLIKPYSVHDIFAKITRNIASVAS